MNVGPFPFALSLSKGGYRQAQGCSISSFDRLKTNGVDQGTTVRV